MKKLALLLSLLLLAFSLEASQSQKVIRFAPLPMEKSEIIIKEYEALLKYLEKETGYIFELHYYADYAVLLDKIKNSEVDIAFLGPLPYVELSKMSSDIKPLIRFIDHNGKATYTCTLFSRQNSAINLKRISNIKVALTQPLSTCGYLAVEDVLRTHQNSLDQNIYEYTGSHTNAIFSVVVGDAELAGAKSDIVEHYLHLGLVSNDISLELPGFLWVGTSSLSEQSMKQIKRAMLQLKPLTNKEDAFITKNWRKNIRYGAVEAYDKDYDVIRNMLKRISIPETEK